MPKGTQKITFSFEETHLTHFGGMWLIRGFCQKRRRRYLIQKYVSTGQKVYAYHIFVTNLKARPWRVCQFYAVRANIEKHIRELVYDYPLAKIPTADWTANVAFFQLVLFACNIVHWFKRLCLPVAWRFATLDTVRADFLVLPARMVKAERSNIVKLPRDYHYRQEFLQALKTTERLHVPRNFRICKWP